jgi:fermentation-respiration switch protein FrsA (DUF1100 family)
VHGETDLAVDVKSAQTLFEAEKNLKDKQLLILKTGHLFGVPYPARDGSVDLGLRNGGQEPAPVLVEAADATVEWFSRYLGKGA